MSSTENDEPRQLEIAEMPGKCTVCHDNLTLEEVALAGYVGMFVMRLCVNCFTATYAMFHHIIQEQETNS